MYKKITAQKNDTKITVIFAGTGTSQTNPFPEEIAIECKHRLGIAKTGKVTFARFINWKSFTATDLKLYLPIPESISDNEVKALIEELLYKAIIYTDKFERYCFTEFANEISNKYESDNWDKERSNLLNVKYYGKKVSLSKLFSNNQYKDSIITMFETYKTEYLRTKELFSDLYDIIKSEYLDKDTLYANKKVIENREELIALLTKKLEAIVDKNEVNQYIDYTYDYLYASYYENHYADSPQDIRNNASIIINASNGFEYKTYMIDLSSSFPSAYRNLTNGYGYSKRKTDIAIFEPVAITKIDGVLITHSHDDHMGRVNYYEDLSKMLGKHILVYGDQSVMNKLFSKAPRFLIPKLFMLNTERSLADQLVTINEELQLTKTDMYISDEDKANIRKNGKISISRNLEMNQLQALKFEYMSYFCDYLKDLVYVAKNFYKREEIIRLLLIKESGNIQSFYSHASINHKLEAEFRYSTVTPHLIKAIKAENIGTVTRTDYRGNSNTYNLVEYTYPELDLNTKMLRILPLDIKHHLNIESRNQENQSIRGSTIAKALIGNEGLDNTPAEFYSIQGFNIVDRGVAYITDASFIPEHTKKILKESNLETLVINGLWPYKKHPGHLSMEEAMDIALQTGAKRVYLTHITNKVPHAETNEYLAELLHFKKNALASIALREAIINQVKDEFFCTGILETLDPIIQKDRNFSIQEDKLKNDYNHVSLYRKTERLINHNTSQKKEIKSMTDYIKALILDVSSSVSSSKEHYANIKNQMEALIDATLQSPSSLRQEIIRSIAHKIEQFLRLIPPNLLDSYSDMLTGGVQSIELAFDGLALDI